MTQPLSRNEQIEIDKIFIDVFDGYVTALPEEERERVLTIVDNISSQIPVHLVFDKSQIHSSIAPLFKDDKSRRHVLELTERFMIEAVTMGADFPERMLRTYALGVKLTRVDPSKQSLVASTELLNRIFISEEQIIGMATSDPWLLLLVYIIRLYVKTEWCRHVNQN